MQITKEMIRAAELAHDNARRSGKYNQTEGFVRLAIPDMLAAAFSKQVADLQPDTKRGPQRATRDDFQAARIRIKDPIIRIGDIVVLKNQENFSIPDYHLLAFYVVGASETQIDIVGHTGNAPKPMDINLFRKITDDEVKALPHDYKEQLIRRRVEHETKVAPKTKPFKSGDIIVCSILPIKGATFYRVIETWRSGTIVTTDDFGKVQEFGNTLNFRLATQEEISALPVEKRVALKVPEFFATSVSGEVKEQPIRTIYHSWIGRQIIIPLNGSRLSCKLKSVTPQYEHGKIVGYEGVAIRGNCWWPVDMNKVKLNDYHWKKGPPPSVGWYPVCFDDIDTVHLPGNLFLSGEERISWWDGELWSLCVSSANNEIEAGVMANRKLGKEFSDNHVSWRQQPIPWPGEKGWPTRSLT